MEPFDTYQELLHKLDNKLDVVNEKISSVDKTQVEIKKDLEYHIARTDILEKEIHDVRKRMEPIESIKMTWSNIAKLCVFLATVIGGLATAFGILFDVFK